MLLSFFSSTLTSSPSGGFRSFSWKRNPIFVFLSSGEQGTWCGSGFLQQHPRGRIVQSPQALLWQPAAAPAVMATGREGEGQGQVCNTWGRSGDLRPTHESAHCLSAPHRHHAGRPWRVRSCRSNILRCSQCCCFLHLTFSGVFSA